MERPTLFSLLARRWLMIIVITVLVFGAAIAFEGRKAPKYFGSFTVTVQASRNYPKSDNLILQSSQAQDVQNAIATTSSWVSDPFYASKALEGAGVSISHLSLKDLSQTFQLVSPIALSSTYQVQYTGSSQDEVRRVFTSLRSVLTEAQNEYDAKQSEMMITLVFTDPTVTSQSSGLPLVPLAGLLIGLVFSLVIAAVYDRSRKA